MRLFARVCLFLTFAGVMFTFSRGGYIALILLAAALIVLNIRHRFAEVSLYIVSALLFLPEEVVNRLFTIKKGINSSSVIADNLVAVTRPDGSIMFPNYTTSEIINNAGAEGAVGERWEIWMEAINRFIERPLFGYGAGTQPSFAIYENIGIKAPHAHNIVLQLLLEGGIIALLIMCVIGFSAVKNGVVLMKNGYNRSFWIGFSLVAFAVCFVAHGMVDYPLMVPRLVAFFIIALGFAEQTCHLYSANHSDAPNTSRKLLSRLRKTTK
jgi:O-antigen ligase